MADQTDRYSAGGRSPTHAEFQTRGYTARLRLCTIDTLIDATLGTLYRNIF